MKVGEKGLVVVLGNKQNLAKTSNRSSARYSVTTPDNDIDGTTAVHNRMAYIQRVPFLNLFYQSYRVESRITAQIASLG